jgi:7,8-dihydroneopterin aldolase/epimerase/oxygenase
METFSSRTATAPSPSSPQAAAPLQAAPPLDLIFIEGFVGETVIGIHESELHRPQPLVIDVQAGVPRARACDTDRIADTIDYGKVCERLRRLLAEHRVQLLEAFAETVAEILIGEFGAHWVRVKVVKPKKFADVSAVGVQIERSAPTGHDRPSRAAAVLQLIGSGMVPGGH